MRRTLIILTVLTLSACAAETARLSAAQCDADWGRVGYADGADGDSAAKLDSYRAACARAGAAISGSDEDAWRRGWSAGRDEHQDDAARQEASRPRSGSGYRGPTISPYRGVGVGSHGVTTGAGVGLGFGAFNLSFYD